MCVKDSQNYVNYSVDKYEEPSIEWSNLCRYKIDLTYALKRKTHPSGESTHIIKLLKPSSSLKKTIYFP